MKRSLILKSKLKVSELKQQDIAIHLGVTEKTVSVKINDPDKWTIGEAEKIRLYINEKKVLNISTIDELFFDRNIPYSNI